MFEDWYFFSGNLEFPVELNFENYSNLSNFLNTPLRLHFAVHRLRYLRFTRNGYLCRSFTVVMVLFFLIATER